MQVHGSLDQKRVALGTTTRRMPTFLGKVNLILRLLFQLAKYGVGLILIILVVGGFGVIYDFSGIKYL